MASEGVRVKPSGYSIYTGILQGYKQIDPQHADIKLHVLVTLCMLDDTASSKGAITVNFLGNSLNQAVATGVTRCHSALVVTLVPAASVWRQVRALIASHLALFLCDIGDCCAVIFFHQLHAMLQICHWLVRSF